MGIRLQQQIKHIELLEIAAQQIAREEHPIGSPVKWMHGKLQRAGNVTEHRNSLFMKVRLGSGIYVIVNAGRFLV